MSKNRLLTDLVLLKDFKCEHLLSQDPETVYSRASVEIERLEKECSKLRSLVSIGAQAILAYQEFLDDAAAIMSSDGALSDLKDTLVRLDAEATKVLAE